MMKKYLGTVRAGIGKFNTEEDIDALLGANQGNK